MALSTKQQWCGRCNKSVQAVREEFSSTGAWLLSLAWNTLTSFSWERLGSGNYWKCPNCGSETRLSKNATSWSTIILIGVAVVLLGAVMLKVVWRNLF